MLPKEMRPDSTWKLIGIPISLWQQARDTVSAASPWEASLLPCQASRRIPTCPSQLDRCPRVAEQTRVSKGYSRCNLRIYPRFPPQPEKKPRDIPLSVIWAPIPLQCRQSKSVFHIKDERSLAYLDGIPETPQEHCHKARGTVTSPQEHERASCTTNQLKMRPTSPALAPEPSPGRHRTWQVACLPLGNARDFLENTGPSLEEHGVQQSN